jgi:hypothetical protein
MLPNPHPAMRGVWAKMARAQEHYAALVDATDAYLAMPPYRVTEKVSEGLRIIRAEMIAQPPERIALIFGDLVQCCRAALDHMAYAFARSVVSEPSRETAFPILRKRPANFAQHPTVAQVPPPVRNTMEALQPYQDDGGIGADIGGELHVLRELSNADKHRVLLVASGIVAPKYVTHNAPSGSDSGIAFALGDDWQSATITVPVATSTMHGPVDPHFEAQVTILEEDLRLPWRSGIEGIAHHLYNETAMTIGAFRLHWDLL